MANCLLSIVAIICSNMALSMGGYLLNNSKIWWKFVAFHSGGKFQKFRGARTKFFFFTTLTKKNHTTFFLLDYHRRGKNIVRFSICLPLEFRSHGPLLVHWIRNTITQFGRIWIVFLCSQAFVGIHMSNGFVLVVVHPGLVATHAVASH